MTCGITHTGMESKGKMVQVAPVVNPTLALGKLLTILNYNSLSNILPSDTILSLDGTPIKCNCDDEKTGITDDNVLRARDQLPVKGIIQN